MIANVANKISLSQSVSVSQPSATLTPHSAGLPVIIWLSLSAITIQLYSGYPAVLPTYQQSKTQFCQTDTLYSSMATCCGLYRPSAGKEYKKILK
jgi:hypothetical protein